MIVLGIESSCDETALALIKDGEVLSSVLASQIEVHALFGGVVPELASREHYRFIGPLFDELLKKAYIKIEDIDYYAVSRGPGLLGALLVGISFVKGLALARQKPLIGVNHLHAHLLVAGLESEIVYPALGVLVSGGHTHLYKMNAIDSFEVLGCTLDDAAGEAFDKVGKCIGLAYPAGRAFNELSQLGIKHDKALFPRPYTDNTNFDFSFSGLKTAATLYLTNNPDLLLKDNKNSQALCDMCTEFTAAIVDTLCIKTERALKQYNNCKTLILAGGVAANTFLRNKMYELAMNYKKNFATPSSSLCTDNAIMVAYAGFLYAKLGLYHDLSFDAIARGQSIPLDWQKNIYC